ncbi:hypothetical protein ACIA8R_00555 [Nonomuraea sp. NPDC051191]|uniref:hypothetical protein n=1 Tax=Nonomuraea sp. NPDC051191 TaxID=3364372 RepID=UPI0037B5BD7F
MPRSSARRRATAAGPCGVAGLVARGQQVPEVVHQPGHLELAVAGVPIAQQGGHLEAVVE